MIEKIKQYGIDNLVPIIKDDSLLYIKEIIKENKVKKIIEIGTAIAYSSLCFSMEDSVIKIDTFERDENMYDIACQNIKLLNKDDIINVHFGDALDVDLSFLSHDYDLLFIDGAKAQSRRFFERFTPYLKKDGIVIVDNIDFHGVKEDDPNISRNLRSLIRKINLFVKWLEENKEYHTVFLKKGDGLAISKKV